ISRTFLSGVARAGAGEAEFEIPGDSFVRLAVRTVDGAALARAVSPPVPRGDMAAEAVAPPAPDRIPGPREGEREQWRLVEYPGILELNVAGALRHAGEFRDGDNADVDEIRSGARLHWKPFEAPFYARFSLEARKAATYPVLLGAEIRANYTFSTRPDLSARVIVQGWVENLHGYTGYSYETDARLRWRQVLDEQWILFVAASMNSWWSSLGDRRAASIEPHPLIHNDYRDDHDRWLAADIRLRAIPWQNVRIDMRAGTRSNRSLLPWDPDRWTYGVDVQAHHEDLFAEFSVVRVLRIDDDHRSRRTSSRIAALDVAWETWLGRGTWMSAGAGFSYDFDDHEREVRASLTFRFGGRDGTRHEHIDPELQRFERYQEARFPWRQ
ncbi:MAG: hypothetical protein HUU15_00640, partial [Candidatus Brocadiae bacterium]|nr:hypothetical protein [Candidatus Brocadiia bacterium]